VVGHVTPEAYVGGPPIGLVKNGDTIVIDAEKRELTRGVTAAEFERNARRSGRSLPPVISAGCGEICRACHERIVWGGEQCGLWGCDTEA